MLSARKVILYVFLSALVLVLLAILARAAIVDFYLRPICLMALLAHGYTLGRNRTPGVLLVLVGLAAAIVVEVVQRLHMPLWMVAAGTAAYYGCYTLGFILNRSARFNLKTLI